MGDGAKIRARKQAEKEAEALAVAEAAAAQHKVEVALSSFIGGAKRLEMARIWMIGEGIMAFAQGLSIDVDRLKSHQIDQLEQYAEAQVEEQRRNRTAILNDAAIDRMRRIKWYSQQ